MPQESPEPPIVYAVLIDELLCIAEARLSVNSLPAGIRMPPDETTREDVERIKERVDDTCVLAETPLDMCYTCSVVAADYSTACRRLHAAKREVLCASGRRAPMITVWDETAFRQYVDTGVAPRVDQPEVMWPHIPGVPGSLSCAYAQSCLESLCGHSEPVARQEGPAQGPLRPARWCCPAVSFVGAGSADACNSAEMET